MKLKLLSMAWWLSGSLVQIAANVDRFIRDRYRREVWKHAERCHK